MIKRIRFLLQESPLFRRMFLVVFISVFLTLLFTGITNMILTRQLIRNDNLQLSITLTKQIAVNLKHRLSAIENEIFTTFVSSVLNRPWPTIESIRKEGGLEQLRNEWMTQQALENIVYSHGYVESLIFIDPLGDYSFVGRDSEANNIRLTDLEIEKLKNQYGGPLWLPFDRQKYLMTRALFDTTALSYMGILICIIDTSSLGDVISESSLQDDITYFLVDDEDKVLLYPHKETGVIQIMDGVWNRITRPYERYIEEQITGTDLQLIMVQSYQSIDQIFRIFVLITIAAGIFAVAVVGLINYRVSFRFYQNVQTLSKGIEEFGVESNTIKVLQTGDEIQQLSLGISSMADRIESLIERVSLEKNRVQKAQYDALMARYSALMSQINPHFLYNALESISSIAQLKDNYEISRIAINLGRMLRTSINRTQTFTKITDEISFVRNLIETYRLVYDSSIELLEEIPEDIQEYGIPTFLLLPLVENAIIHGELAHHKKGIIRISAAWTDNRRVLIKVCDNGIGIPKNEIENILNGNKIHRDSEWEHTRIGIPSIIERLSILYDDRTDFMIENGMNGGTDITVVLPGEVQNWVPEKS